MRQPLNRTSVKKEEEAFLHLWFPCQSVAVEWPAAEVRLWCRWAAANQRPALPDLSPLTAAGSTVRASDYNGRASHWALAPAPGRYAETAAGPTPSTPNFTSQ